MQRSNWREEIELSEFVQTIPLITKVAATADLVNKARQNPLVQKGFKAIKNKAADLLTPKSFKEIDKPKVEVKPEVNTNVKGFKPKGFTPSKEIENERQKLIKQRELEKIEKEKIEKLKPIKEPSTKPVETPKKVEDPKEDPQREKTDDNKKKITKIRNNQNNNEKNINKNDLNNKDKNKDKSTTFVPFGFKTRQKNKTFLKNKNKKRVPAGTPRRLPRLPLPNKKPINPQARAIERLAATRDRDGDGKLERKRKSGEYQETFNHNISETSTMNTQSTNTNPNTKPKPKPIATSSVTKKIQSLSATRDRDGDGKVERRRKSGEFQETLLYDVVLDYILSENFASDTESANKVMLKLSDELMQEIYERTMTSSEKRKDTMLKKKYDDSDMKKNMQDQYGKEEGKKVYFATIRKQAMKKEEYISEIPALAAIPAAIGKGAAVVGKAALGAAKATGKAAISAGKATGKAAVKGTKAVGKAGLEGVKAGAYAAGETVATTAGEIAADRMRKKYLKQNNVEEEVGVSTAMTNARKEAELKRKEAVAVAMAKKVRNIALI